LVKKERVNERINIFSNELISRDEALHTEFAIYLYNTYCSRFSQHLFTEMMKEAVEIEKEFIM
jgi:ribonucleotide reductase beta subunit family protein with ferritin-like domain